MKSVTHPNLIKLEEVYESKKVRYQNFLKLLVFFYSLEIIFLNFLQKLYIITELCEAGELAKWLKKNGPMKEDKSKIIMRKIVDAISYLHKNGKIFLKVKEYKHFSLLMFLNILKTFMWVFNY